MKIIYTENPFCSSVFLTDEEKKKFFQTALEELDFEEEDSLFLLEELEAGTHMGDCTCIPMTCNKCLAESLIGVDTLEGLGKHEGNYLSEIFKNTLTAKEALERAKSKYNLKRDGTWRDAHIDRWNQERQRAIKWLENYIEKGEL